MDARADSRARVRRRRDTPRLAAAPRANQRRRATTRDDATRATRARMEHVSFEGLRADGRRANECRRIRHEFAVDADADGSARFEIGNTVVQAAVRGPRERRGPREEGASDACEVTATYGASAAAADGARGRRRGDRKALQHATTLTKILDRVVMTELMPRSAIEVTCVVLCDDGGAKAASVNAATLALADAGVPLRDTAGAVTCGYLDGEVLIDLNREEERGRGPELLMCSTGPGAASRANAASDDEDDDDEGVDVSGREIIAEELDRGKTTMETYDAMHDLAIEASAVISARMREATLERTRALAATRALEKF